jgi:hypothetical protein
MTAQSMEQITYEGKLMYMASEPLELYLASLPEPIEFIAPHTACWRGYEGQWEIIDDKLFMTGFTGYVNSTEEMYKPVDLSFLFPDQKKVFAEWFNGEIRIPLGKMKHYVHMGYESMYERDLYIEIVKGKVVRKIEIDNP